MGNYSRNTFNKAKGYTSVRLQQGVPLVDADWNEQADILRNQTADSIDYVLGGSGSGVPPGSYMSLSGTGLQNDFTFDWGRVMVDGRLVTVGSGKYSVQPWTNAQKAAADGVPVIPALTTPSGNRDDCVYLDVWEREVNSIEDPNLVNSVIGVETAVRTKWAAAVRVNENSHIAAPAPAGHTHIRMAVLKRTASAVIGTYDVSDPTGSVLDVRPVLPIGDSFGILNVPPVFFPISGYSQWANLFIPNFKLRATKPAGQNQAVGGVLLRFPEGARVTQITARGNTSDNTIFQFVRTNQNTSDISKYDLLYQFTETKGVTDPRPYVSSWAFDDSDPKFRVDNRNYLYTLYVNATGSAAADIYWIWFNYRID
ncbi:MAG TPA: DUF6519 domain-containing protein [Polyangia bacterium]|jgi:hypothetical protein|nr:DUF6519 domain-containing protein [Polyangia bacterium]